MQAQSYGDSLIQLTRFPRLFPVNCYLVREADGFTLIDTAIAGSGKQIIAAAQKFNTPIVRIVLTHAHGDHAGSLDELHTALPQAEIIVARRSVPILAGNRSLEAGEPVDQLRGSWVVAKTQANRTVEAGDRIGSLEVIASPGHTPDSIAFLDTRTRTLIAGDAFQTRGGIAVSGTLRPFFPFPAWATWHKPTALESACALRQLNPTALAVGHGTILANPLAAMDDAIAAAQRTLPEQQVQHVR